MGSRPDGNKLARAIPAADMMEHGRILFPRHAPWLDTVQAEVLAFPNGKHDDIVDVVTYAAQHIASQTRRRRTKLVGWTLDPALRKPTGV